MALQIWQTPYLHRLHGTIVEHAYAVADWHVMWQNKACLGRFRALAGRSLICVVLAGLTVPRQVSVLTAAVKRETARQSSC